MNLRNKTRRQPRFLFFRPPFQFSDGGNESRRNPQRETPVNLRNATRLQPRPLFFKSLFFPLNFSFFFITSIPGFLLLSSLHGGFGGWSCFGGGLLLVSLVCSALVCLFRWSFRLVWAAVCLFLSGPCLLVCWFVKLLGLLVCLARRFVGFFFRAG